MLRRTVRLIRDVRRDRRFPTEYAAFRGVHPDFAAAVAAGPGGRPIGYDHDHLAAEYVDATPDEAESYDYPVLFHLGKLLAEGVGNVFDFGGNTGLHLYVYRRHLDIPSTLRWTVCELPALVRAGEELARRRDEPRLHFTTDMDAASGADVFLSSGAVQYLEEPTLAAYLARLDDRPRHLLLNRIPLYDGPGFATLQNGGSVYYPQRVFNRAEFLASLEDIGYKIVDVWKDHVDVCHIPFHPDRSLSFYRGVHARL